MNTQLEPPPVQLPPGIEQRVRNRVLAVAARSDRPRRRWAPVLAAATVTAVVAAGTVLADRVREGPAVGSESDVLLLDAGPVAGPERDAAVDACFPGHAGRDPVQVRYVRRVNDFSVSPVSQRVVVALRAADGTDFVCGANGGVGGPLGQPAPPPSAATPLVPLGGSGEGLEMGPGDTMTIAHAYLVHSSVRRLETRLTWPGGAGPWYRAALADGIAFTAATAPLVEDGDGQMVRVTPEHRAFDADGDPVPLPR